MGGGRLGGVGEGREKLHITTAATTFYYEHYTHCYNFVMPANNMANRGGHVKTPCLRKQINTLVIWNRIYLHENPLSSHPPARNQMDRPKST